MNRNTLLASLTVAAIVSPAFASAKPVAVTSVDEALKQAASGTSPRLVFIEYGREACGNCRHLRQLVARGAVRLPKAKFVYADVNCDDAKSANEFGSKFKVSGNTLPFVVIADAKGRQLASRSGYGESKDYEALIREAVKKSKEPAKKES